MPQVLIFLRTVAKSAQLYVLWGATLGALTPALSIRAQQVDIPGPAGSVSFGTSITVLPNGNFVVTDPDFQASGIGAVYLYSPSRTLLSTLIGSSTGDHVGNGSVVVVGDGNFVVVSPDWNNGVASGAGAVTWVNGVTGLSDVVSAGNSLVGTTTGDNVGRRSGSIIGVTVLKNGNYVVASPYWNNGVAGSNVGAATWANGNTGITGAVSADNSLAGTTPGDQLGVYNNQGAGVIALSNGNYVVATPTWNNGVAGSYVGAVTLGDGNSGIVGVVSAANSLIGSNINDGVGSRVIALTNGNYVVGSRYWNNALGAATWGNGSSGITGTVSSSNSLVGTNPGDLVGNFVFALSNGNYVVIAGGGSATWGNGNAGVTGLVTAGNSLLGNGISWTTPLSNGNYVVSSATWANGIHSQVGAATWCNGSQATTGTISASNSLVGSTTQDYVGAEVTALTNGNYVVNSSYWNNGNQGSQVGAVTWGNGTTGIAGLVSASNSLVGTNYGDNVGLTGVTALSNGNFVVASGYWGNGFGYSQVGAATWGNGSSGIVGPVSGSNSLVGTTAGDRIGFDSVQALNNGNYVVVGSEWSNGAIGFVYGAATWGNGSSGIKGPASASNSLIGTSGGDRVSNGGIKALSDGNYLVVSPNWNGRGAVTFASGASGLRGTIQPSNSVLGAKPGGGARMVVAYDPVRRVVVVGRPADNIVSLFADQVFASGFEP